MGAGLNHPYESLQTWDIPQFQSFYNTQDQGKKNRKQANIMAHYTIITIQDLLKRSPETEPKTGDNLPKEKGKGQTVGLLALLLKWGKDLSASIPWILTNLTLEIWSPPWPPLKCL